jgi:hypothetical protein
MRRSNTHFEQIPIEAVQALVTQEIHDNENTEQLEQAQEKDTKTSLKED